MTVLMLLCGRRVSGAIFVVALLHEFALVEIAASIVTAANRYFLSSAISDLLEGKKANRGRKFDVVLVTIFLVAFYSFHALFSMESVPVNNN